MTKVVHTQKSEGHEKLSETANQFSTDSIRLIEQLVIKDMFHDTEH